MKCKATKRDGTPCRANAVKGSDYCSYHKKALAKEPLAKEESVPAIHSKKEKPIRFLAKGTYTIPNGHNGNTVHFHTKGQVEPVDYSVWTHLLETQPQAFEEA